MDIRRIIGYCLIVVSFNCHAGDWTSEEKSLELVYDISTAIDWTQTLRIDSRYHETNPILGKHPTQSTINIYMPTSMLLHYLISDHLENRKAFQYFTLGVEMNTIYMNFRIGL